MYGITVLGFALWLAFGMMNLEWPIIITNSVCLLLSASVFTMTVLPRDEKDAVADILIRMINATYRMQQRNRRSA